MPEQMNGLIVFAHGSGTDGASEGDDLLAERLHQENFATLLLDLFTEEEETIDEHASAHYDVGTLGARLATATDWILDNPDLENLDIGYFGSGVGAAAALIAAAERPHVVSAIVSRGGRLDLSLESLGQVRAPTLLIVGEEDGKAYDVNRMAFFELRCEKRFEVIAGGTHLLKDPEDLASVAAMSVDWFRMHMSDRA